MIAQKCCLALNMARKDNMSPDGNFVDNWII